MISYSEFSFPKAYSDFLGLPNFIRPSRKWIEVSPEQHMKWMYVNIFATVMWKISNLLTNFYSNQRSKKDKQTDFFFMFITGKSKKEEEER